MSKPTPTPPAEAQKVNAADTLFEASVKLLNRMITVEQDPDLISVFSIARAHGYKTTSKFWQEELMPLKQALDAYDAERKAKPAPVIPIEEGKK